MPEMPASIITTGINFKFAPADLVDAATFKAALQAAVETGKASRIYIWPPFKGLENASEAAVYEDTPLATMRVRDGKYAWRFFINENICLHKAMFSHRSNSGRVFIIDSANQIIGMNDVSGNFMGLSISLLNTEKMVFNDGSATSKSPIYLVLKNNKEFDQNGTILSKDIAYVVNEVVRLADVDLTISGAVAASGFAVKVSQTCDGTLVSGLVKADFVVTNNAGATQSVSTVVESSEGIYTVTPTTTFIDGYVDLVVPASLTVDAYESTGKATVNIP
jgi:hypothetical protein